MFRSRITHTIGFMGMVTLVIGLSGPGPGTSAVTGGARRGNVNLGKFE
jgi:hypothetical protein